MSVKEGSRFRKSFAAGIVAGALAIGISLLIRSLTGGPFLPEIASQTLFSLTPGEFESQAVENFGPLAKYSAFIAAIVINFILYGLFGIIADKINAKSKWKGYIGKAFQSSMVAYVILLIISILLITTIQFRTGARTVSIPLLAVSLVLPQLVFGFIFSSFFRTRQTIKKLSEESPDTQTRTVKRSEFLRFIVVSAIAVPILYFGLNRLFSEQGQEQEQQESALSSSQSLPIPKSIPAWL